VHTDAMQALHPEAALAMRTQAAVLTQPALAEAATALAAELAQAFACERVGIGMLRQQQVLVIATSHGAELQAKRDAASSIAAAMHEALDQSTSVCFPALPGTTPITLANQLLAAAGRHGSTATCSVPMKGAREVIGAVTLERASRPFTAAEVALCEDLVCFAGPVLELKQQAEMPWWRRSLNVVRKAWTDNRSTGRRLALAGVALVLLAATLIPLPYRVSAPARLEGSVQRAIVAAADGFLQQANVRAGDTVKEGQVLAELASQDLQLERRRRESEMRQHENAYKTAQSRNDRAQMVISQSKAGEAQALLALVDSQIERARIQAPFDGVVIKGDLSQNLGAPVQRGEVLLTIAPSDSFRIIVEVEETDIAAIQPGQRGQLALAAMPERRLDVTVQRVVPVATAADARNYFEVEASLDTPGVALRPGLRGVAKIDAGEHSLLWLLTHRAMDWLSLSIWSIGL
jgi:RND family efflux transporter MFP subunit